MSNVLGHRFVSPKLDGSDLTQVQPSAWNDGHRFSGGTDGQVLTRSTADAAFGAVWGPRPGATTYLHVTLAAGSYVDWDPGIVGATVVTIATGGNADITGIKPAVVPYPGQLLRLVLTAAAPGKLVLFHEHSASTVGYQVRTRPASPVLITGYWGFAELQWGPGPTGVTAWLLGAYGDGHPV